MMAQYGRTVLTPQSQSGLPVAEAVFNAGDSCFVNAAYFDTDGNPFTPASVQYRVDDLTGGMPIVPAWAPVTPVGTTNQITITSAQNAMVSLTRGFETHQIMLWITDAGGNPFFPTAKFEIRQTIPPVPGWSAASGDTQESS